MNLSTLEISPVFLNELKVPASKVELENRKAFHLTGHSHQ